MLFFIAVFIVYFLINTYIFLKGWKALNPSFAAKFIYCLIFFVFFSSFSLAMLLRNSLPLPFLKPIYFIGTTWLAATLYLSLYFILTDFVKFLDKKIYFLPGKWRRNPRLFFRLQVISGYSILLVLLLYGYYHYSHPEIVRQNISIAKQAGNRKELKVVGISDLHLGISVDKKSLAKYVKLINEQKPDVVIISGDLIDNNLRPLVEEKMWEEINQLNAPLGVFMCLGNHEYLSDIEESLTFLKKTKINLLIDRTMFVGESFYVAGRDDKMNKDRKELNEILSDVDPSYPIILLNHQPYGLEEAEIDGIDLQFSGHTHNGQLFPLNLIVKNIFEICYGYKQKGNTHYYISSGLALWGPPYRIGTQSELVVFDIQFK